MIAQFLVTLFTMSSVCAALFLIFWAIMDRHDARVARYNRIQDRLWHIRVDRLLWEREIKAEQAQLFVQ